MSEHGVALDKGRGIVCLCGEICNQVEGKSAARIGGFDYYVAKNAGTVFAEHLREVSANTDYSALYEAERAAHAELRERVRELADIEEARGCHYRHQQGETDECNACTAARVTGPLWKASALVELDGEGEA